MAFKSQVRSDAVAQYVNETMLHETDVQRRLRAATAQLPVGGMQISADQGALLAFLVRMLGARRALEIGTFTGYSTLCVAMALPADGRLIACDVSAEWTTIAQRYWKEAGVADRIELRLAPALETLAALQQQGAAGSFDFAFIDADKVAYDAYYEAALKLLRPGGVIAMDNVLGSGPNTDNVDYDPATSKMHPLNMKIRADQRVDAMLATVGAGFMLVRKK